MIEDNIRPECKNCMDHGIVTLKLGQICQWKEAHDAGTNKWRTHMEKEINTMKQEKIEEHNELRNESAKMKSELKTYAIANLTGLVMVLLVLLAHLVFRT